ncbi:unnamed protein product [Cylindrotheca closterium]|uniref:Uncharacterized protein n=1 Tax=Cylindrotheca closterium TaxID=2856 RepID=A0AAD2G456_9STRA|nr:unnamed protein product [Cylindrotheca closterium]
MRFVNRKGVYVLEQLGANVEPGAKETNAIYHRQLSNLNNQPHFELSSNKQNGYAGLEMTSKMATVRKNKEGFTPRQVKAAMEARSAMHILNAPSTKSLKYAIRSGLIKNCPITKEAINHAEAIFGPDASTLKGKSTRPTPKKTYNDFFSPPEELYQHNRSITVCIDHMEIKNAKFLTCIDTTIGNEMKADYEEHDAILIARCMMQIKAKFNTDEGLNSIQQYDINQGLKKFGDDGKDAVDKELRQMLLRDCFALKFVKDMTASERK